VNAAGMCCTMRIGIRGRAGWPFNTCVNACGPLVEVPITTISGERIGARRNLGLVEFAAVGDRRVAANCLTFANSSRLKLEALCISNMAVGLRI